MRDNIMYYPAIVLIIGGSCGSGLSDLVGMAKQVLGDYHGG